MENGGAAQSEGKDPSSFLSNIIGNAVVVKLNSGVVYKGKCNYISTCEKIQNTPYLRVRPALQGNSSHGRDIRSSKDEQKS